MGNVVPTHLLDRVVNDFARVRAGGFTPTDGDIAFDDDPCTAGPAASILTIDRIGRA
jgi:tRNA 2-thiocytidine biosynthesis protein TtcA